MPASLRTHGISRLVACMAGLAAFWLAAAPARAQHTLVSLYSFTAPTGSDPRGALIQGTDGSFYGTTYKSGSGGYGTVFKVSASGTLTTLVNFNNANGSDPSSGVIQGTDGNFYGTTQFGGSAGMGTVFKATPAGTLTTLYTFSGGSDGGSPSAGLVQGSDGNFYGTTDAGGASGKGTVFKITPSGGFRTLVTFTSSTGAFVEGNLIQGSDGNFYGTTQYGGTSGFGTVFKMTSSGALTTLYNFSALNGSDENTDGGEPYDGLVQGNDGNFYGTTLYGGPSGAGTAFKITSSGALTTLVNFMGTNGANPSADLLQGRDGNFYGTTSAGGVSGSGTAFKMTSSGLLTTLINFNAANGANPTAGLVQGNDGNFYGVTPAGGTEGNGTVFSISPSGTLATLVNFIGANLGASPSANLVQGSDGSFYGTTYVGGSANNGTIFKVSSFGSLTPLSVFTGTSGANPGSTPMSGLVQGVNGNFYGTTSAGGSSGDGTVFDVSSAGVVTTLVTFTSTNGSVPEGNLILGSDGNFYGTTANGGSSGDGTVFKMSPLGSLTTLVSFTGSTGANPGARPSGGLIQGSDGDFYGTTEQTGAYGGGTVFKITPTGTLTTLYNFGEVSGDGDYPNGGLVQGSDGNFYGTTYEGGSSIYGTVFKVSSTGSLTTLVDFNVTNGAYPAAGLILGADGNFYGTTTTGALSGYGNIFQMTSSGSLTTLANFNQTTGVYPNGLIQGTDGNFYGTTQGGGSQEQGTIFGLFGPPLGFTATETADENTPVTFPVSFSDASGQGITGIAFPSPPSHGTLAVGAITETGSAGTVALTYTPAVDYYGSDLFTYTVTGVTGTSSPQSVTLAVGQVPVRVIVDPATVSLVVNGTQTFTATVTDGSGAPFTPNALAWSVSGGGTIDTNGNFTAGMTPGTYVVTATATSGGVTQTGTATVVVGGTPAVTISSPSFTLQTQAAFSATATASDGNPLTYSWSVSPSASPGLVNPATGGIGSGAAFTNALSVTAAGTYTVTVTVTDDHGQTATASEIVTFGQVPATVMLSPATISVPESGSQAFTVAVTDQFGNAYTPVSLSWSVSGGGTINAATGAFTAGTIPGAYAVTAIAASDGFSKSGSANVTVYQPAMPTSMTLSAASVYGGQTDTLTVTLSGPAPAGGLVITLTSSNPSAATLPATITIPAGQTVSPSVPVTTFPVNFGTDVTMTASVNGGSATTALVVSPPVIQGIALSPAAVVGGNQSVVTVTLNAPAPPYGEYCALSSNNAAAVVPNSVTIPPGATGATAMIQTSRVTSTQTATITAQSYTGTGSATLTITPPPAPPMVTITPGTQTPTQVSLSATATSGDGTALTYAWSVTPSVMPGFASAVTGSVASGAPFTNTLSVTAAGTYTVTVTITDAYGQTATATQSVAFTQTPTTVTVSPSSISLAENGTQTFTASVTDQYGAVISAPSVAWSVSGGGTINAATGAFTAGTTPGAFTVTATATSNGVTQTGTARATVFNPAPTIASITPTSGSVGTVVTINGTYLNGVTAVRFHNASAKVFAANASGTQMTVTVPQGAAKGTITVTTPGGVVSSAQTFTVTTVAVPTITSFTPTSGLVGTSVVITGTNFTGAQSVTFHGTAATFTVNSATQITATVPSGATTGAISVTTAGGTATSTGSFTVTNPGPTITSFTPASGPVGTVVTLLGTNLGGASAVRFHNASAKTFTVNGAGTQLTVTVPSGAATGTITVTTPGGSVKTVKPFTVTGS